jgi:diacylglycerol kinase
VNSSQQENQALRTQVCMVAAALSVCVCVHKQRFQEGIIIITIMMSRTPCVWDKFNEGPTLIE